VVVWRFCFLVYIGRFRIPKRIYDFTQLDERISEVAPVRVAHENISLTRMRLLFANRMRCLLFVVHFGGVCLLRITKIRSENIFEGRSFVLMRTI